LNRLSGAGAAQPRPLLLRLVQQFREPLRAHPHGWGLVGCAFASNNSPAGYRDAVAWMADWQERGDCEPWMLINLAIAYRGLGDFAQANRVSRQALGLKPDYTTKYHHIWLAADEVLTGNAAVARTHLAAPGIEKLDATHRFLLAVVESVLRVQEADRVQHSQAFADAKRKLASSVRECKPLSMDRIAVMRMYRRCVCRLGKDGGTIAATLWSWWRWLSPMLPDEK
jgi:hypothetical protein